MRKCILAILYCFFFSITIFSQDSLLSRSSTGYINNDHGLSPLIVIKGDELKRFPSTNFLDAVNGLFPWVFSEMPDPNNFLFVVNGYVLQDINALSLYDIDEIAFTRNTLNGSLYPFSRAGIFYIKTKISNNKKPEINFNSQYNVVWNNNAHALSDPNATAFPPLNSIDNKTGGVFTNQISLSAGGKKLHLYSSVQLDAAQEPHLYQQRILTFAGSNLDTALANLKERQTNLRSFLNAEYNFTDKLKAGIIANYFHSQTRQDYFENGSLQSNESYNETEASRLPLQNYHIGTFVNWNPLPGLKNKFSFEFANDNFNYKQTGEVKTYQADTLASTLNILNTVKPYNKSYLFRDQLDYEFLQNKKFRASGTAVFSYMHNTFFSQTVNFESQGGLNFSQSISTMSGKERLTTLDPAIRFSYNDFLTGYAGYNFFLNKGYSKLSKNSRTNPYAGIVINLGNALKLKSVDRLDVSFDYGDLPENGLNNYWLPFTDPQQYYFSSQIFTTNQPVLIPNPSLQYILLKNKLTGFQVNAGFFNNKLLVGSEWTSLELQRFFVVPVPVGGNSNSYILVLGKETQKGFSIYLSEKLLDNAKMHWTTRLNLLFPHIKYEIDGVLPQGDEPVNYTLQSGLQNKFQYKEFTLQVNVLYGYNRKYFITGNNMLPEQKTFSEFSLNYFVLAYDLPEARSGFLKNTSVFIQGRNLLSSKNAKDYYRYDSYGGAGVNLKFR